MRSNGRYGYCGTLFRVCSYRDVPRVSIAVNSKFEIMKKYRLPEQSLGDVMDKLTILSRKLFFGEEEAYKEHTYLCEAIDKLGIKLSGALLASIIRLNQVNFEIWNRENELRRASNGDPMAGFSEKEVARRAIEIRDFNRKRVRYKNEINRLTKLGFREFKVRHRSQ